MLLASDQRRVRYVPLQMVQALENECKEALTSGLQSGIQGGLSFIYPQTKWCGPGLWNQVSGLTRPAFSFEGNAQICWKDESVCKKLAITK